MSATSGDSSSLVGMPAVITLPADPTSARRARKFVADALQDERTEQWEMAAKLLVTELVTNAILHARTEVTVTVSLEGDELRLAVRDGSARMPSARAYDLEAATGRGLALVNRLSSRWGVDPDESGKTIWAVLGPVDWSAMFDEDDLDLSAPEGGSANPESGPEPGMSTRATA
jgi:anti-sigma regulatory factor (Ser/Thr protein kinase)